MNELLPDNPESKISVCAEKSYEIWKDTAAQKSAQLIFCDLSTPKGDGSFNVYDDLKQKLMEKGVPEKEIALVIYRTYYDRIQLRFNFVLNVCF